MNILSPKEVLFSATSIVDPVGRIFSYQDRIFRTIQCKKSEELYRELLQQSYFSLLCEKGLIDSWISDDIGLPGIDLILEHKKLAFPVHPAEMTILSIWTSVKMLVTLEQALIERDLQLKDSHPWNLMFDEGKPVYIDFGSVVRLSQFCTGWYEELKRFYLIPLWIHKVYGEKLSQEYRREHLKGFGQLFISKHLINDCHFPQPIKPASDKATIFQLLNEIEVWLDSFSLKAEPQKWSQYQQSGDTSDPLIPVSDKHKFVYQMLVNLKPKTVLDMAANKGFYSEVAARLGAVVICFDNEEFNVDACNELAKTKNLNITSVLLDFLHPNPASGLGLLFPDSFSRFNADCIMALGIIHHICIGLGIPLSTFVHILLSYKPSSIIIEFVSDNDVHVLQWKKNAPRDYSLSGMIDMFTSAGYKLIADMPLNHDGVDRTMLAFHKD